MNETRTERVTIDGITHGRYEPNAPMPTGPRPISLEGFWQGAGNVTNARQLVEAGIGVHPAAVEASWGVEGLADYHTALKKAGATPITPAENPNTAAEASRLNTVREELGSMIQ